MHTRLFTFGCSFTRYKWPTWADIMAQEFDDFENWGKPGMGNHFILYSLIECINRRKLTKFDTVAIMWTGVAREDYYANNHWLSGGNMFESPKYLNLDRHQIEKFIDMNGLLIKNFSIIDAVKKILDSIGCKYYFLSMTPLEGVYDLIGRIKEKLNLFNFFTSTDSQIKQLYSETLNIIHKSVFEIIYNYNWNYNTIDYDVEQFIIDNENQYNIMKGTSWPDSFRECFAKRNLIKDKFIKNEIDIFFNSISRIVRDPHPKPLEHFEYLEKLNIINLTEKQKLFATYWHKKLINFEIDVRSDENNIWMNSVECKKSKPVRF